MLLSHFFLHSSSLKKCLFFTELPKLAGIRDDKKTLFPERSCHDNLNMYPFLTIMLKSAQLFSGEIFKHDNVKSG